MGDYIKNVFISHIHEDDDVLQGLKGLLKSNGYEIRDGSIHSDKPNDAKSEDYIKGDVLAPRIRWAGAMIVLVSPDTHGSTWVDWEIEYAHKMGKRIIGLWDRGAKDADMPRALEKYRDAMVGWNAKALIEALNGNDESVTADGLRQPVRTIDRIDCQ